MLVSLRCYFILTLFVITLSSVTKDLLSFDGLDGVDHAPLASGHIDVAQKFITENLKKNGSFSLLKANGRVESPPPPVCGGETCLLLSHHMCRALMGSMFRAQSDFGR